MFVNFLENFVTAFSFIFDLLYLKYEFSMAFKTVIVNREGIQKRTIKKKLFLFKRKSFNLNYYLKFTYLKIGLHIDQKGAYSVGVLR